MQRSLSAVVLVSALSLWAERAQAQSSATGPAPSTAAVPKPAATGTAPKPAATGTAPKPAATGTAPKPAATGTASKPAATGTAPKPAAQPSDGKKPDDRLSDEAELARVVGLYDAGKYRDCVGEVERLLDPLGKAPLRQPSIVENARVYWAACLIGAGEGDAAEAPLRAAIHENPQMKPPDSLVFPQPVVQRFLKVRDSLVNEIRAAEQARIKVAQAEARQRQQGLERDRSRMLALEKLAQQEPIVIRNRRALSFVPFGVGQLQNRQELLGYSLMVSELALGGMALAAVAMQTQFATDAYEARLQGRPVVGADLDEKQQIWGTVRTATFWSFAGLAAIGILQAQLEYVPEFREVRTRPLPPELTSSPSKKPIGEVSYAPYFDQEGGGLSVMGRF